MAGSPLVNVPTLTKTPGERVVFAFDWSLFPEIEAGAVVQRLISLTVTPTLGAPPIHAWDVQGPGLLAVLVEEGGDPGDYLVEVLVDLSDGSKLSGFGYVTIETPPAPAT